MKKNLTRILSLLACACFTLVLPLTAAFALPKTTAQTTGTETIITTLTLGGTSSVHCGQQYQESATLTYDSSTALSGKTITFTVNGTSVGTAVTNGSGVATLTITAPSTTGKYTVAASFGGESPYLWSSDSKTLVVTKNDTSLSVSNASGNSGGTASLTATLTSGTTSTSGKTVAFTVNGASVGTATTDASGKATLSYPITESTGYYPITAAFTEDESCLGSSNSARLKVLEAESATPAPEQHADQTIMASAGDGGSISPSGKVYVMYGFRKSFTITANDGYEIADVVVDGKSVGAVSTYTFLNVRKEHTISASFQETSAGSGGNGGSNSNLPLYIRNMANLNPTGDLTRVALIDALYRLSGDTGTYTGDYSDVPSGIWYESASAWAAANGIDEGTGDGLFAARESVTREQLAVILWNFANYMGLDVSVGEDTNILSYNDAASVSDDAFEALQWACGAGLLTDDGSGNLNPQEPATRGTVAAILQKLAEELAN